MIIDSQLLAVVCRSRPTASGRRLPIVRGLKQTIAGLLPSSGLQPKPAARNGASSDLQSSGFSTNATAWRIRHFYFGDAASSGGEVRSS